MLVKLKDIISYSSNKINSKNLSTKNYISTENMLSNFNGIVPASSLPYNTNVTKFSKNDILLSNIRPYFKKLYYTTFDGGCSNDVLCFTINDMNLVNPKYLYYYLSTDDFFDYVVSTSKGTKMPRGDKKAILNYELELHSFTQQLHIVDIIAYLILLLLSLLTLDFLLIFLLIH